MDELADSGRRPISNVTGSIANLRWRMLVIEHLAGFPDNVVAVVCKGRVAKADYDAFLIPIVTNTLKNHQKVRLYYEAASDFGGIDPAAVWKDFKVGMEHFTRWERIAVVTDVEWIQHTVRFFSFLMPGVTKLFAMADAAQARHWIAAA